MTKYISESGMRFGPFTSNQLFQIEQCHTYRKIQKSVKIAEFILLKQIKDKPTLWVIEAKSSSPQPANSRAWDEFVTVVKDKWINAFALCLSLVLQRHGIASTELPRTFQSLELSSLCFRFILVINGHQEEWLSPLRDILMRELSPTLKTWAIPVNSVIVINDSLAQELGLIS